MSSFKTYFKQKKFEEEIEIDVANQAGAVYKIPLGSTYEGPVDREGLKNSYIVVHITDENEDGGLVILDKVGIFKFFFELHKEKNDKGIVDFHDIFEPNEIDHIFNELKNIIFMFKDHIKQDGKEFNGFSFDIKEKGELGEKRKKVYEKIFKVLPGKLEQKSSSKYIYWLDK
jgi:hypothetical protein